ncbi:hypothetical protein [Deinococcus sp. UYEF24]
MKAKVTGVSAWQGTPTDGTLDIEIFGRYTDSDGNATVSHYSGKLDPVNKKWLEPQTQGDLWIVVQGPVDGPGPRATFTEVLSYGPGKDVRTTYTRTLISSDLQGLLFDYAQPSPVDPVGFGNQPLTMRAAQTLVNMGPMLIALAGAVPYSSFSVFPAATAFSGRGAVALDTGGVYRSDGVTWGAPVGYITPKSAVDLLTLQMAVLTAAQAGGAFGYLKLSDMNADLAHPAGAIGKVSNDPNPVNNGDYTKVGPSGGGNWTLGSPTRTAILENRLAGADLISYPAGRYIGGLSLVATIETPTGALLAGWEADGTLHVYYTAIFDTLTVSTLNVLNSFVLAAANITALTAGQINIAQPSNPIYLNGETLAALAFSAGGATDPALMGFNTAGSAVFPYPIIAPNVGASQFPTGYTVDAAGLTRINGVRVKHGPDVVVEGDSLAGTDLTNALQTVSGRNCYSYAIGGQSSTEIAARLGAYPVWFTTNGGTLAANLNAQPITLLRGINLLNGPAALGVSLTLPGSLNGVAGVLTGITTATTVNSVTTQSTAYTFTRNVAGAAVTMNSNGDQFIPDLSRYADKILVLSVGRNNYNDSVALKRDLANIVARMSPYCKHIYVMSIPNGDYDAEKKDTASHPYFDMLIGWLDYFSSSYRLIDYWSPMSANTASYLVPAALRADSIHYNAPGNTARANIINAQFIKDGV